MLLLGIIAPISQIAQLAAEGDVSNPGDLPAKVRCSGRAFVASRYETLCPKLNTPERARIERRILAPPQTGDVDIGAGDVL